jgi:hypothetical protein
MTFLRSVGECSAGCTVVYHWEVYRDMKIQPYPQSCLWNGTDCKPETRAEGQVTAGVNSDPAQAGNVRKLG